MNKVKIITFGWITIAAIVGFIFYINISPAPSLVAKAQERLGSYISYSFGPQHCVSAKNKNAEWEITCDAKNSKRSFKYLLTTDKNEPPGYYFTAISKDAKETYKVDLISYLDIRTKLK
ncbi:hypothetical protein FH968_00970 [Buttiauxella sp. B2]|uniref:hypothetical protein n=1 Tax=Buttiauxella sp. B2 TaxID=2587812 RepID=UPI00111EEDED|nr:hypothetical protein [Buttiauxella sp. B2]TNV22659.1 hypothetical protein FH968_00970 [Buttiauxella sp. B2]